MRVTRSLLSGLLGLVVLAMTAPALAQEDPRGRGVVGGALVGAELTLIGEAIAGVQSPWAYFVGGVAGGAAGAAAGSVVERQANEDVSLVLLAAGVGLVIPTIVWVGNATQPEPPPPETVRWLPPRVDVAVDRSGPRLSVELLRAAF